MTHMMHTMTHNLTDTTILFEIKKWFDFQNFIVFTYKQGNKTDLSIKICQSKKCLINKYSDG